MSPGEVPAGARDVRLLLHDRGHDDGPSLRYLLPLAGPPQWGHSALEQLHTAGLGTVAAAQPPPGRLTQEEGACDTGRGARHDFYSGFSETHKEMLLLQVFIFSRSEVAPGVYECWGNFAESWGLKAYVTWMTLAVFILPVLVIIVCQVKRVGPDRSRVFYFRSAFNMKPMTLNASNSLDVFFLLRSGSSRRSTTICT